MNDDNWTRWPTVEEEDGFEIIPTSLGEHVVMIVEVDENDKVVNKWYVIESDYVRRAGDPDPNPPRFFAKPEEASAWADELAREWEREMSQESKRGEADGA